MDTYMILALARTVTKPHPITPVLKKLHWLKNT